ncbi:MAG: YhfC family intramembrane metalloprotease [Chloroflexi bacterium]|nr:YhfC family intramembrane metalloprotease [Chloroflexota bacterium]
MLETAYVISFLGMIVLPIIVAIYLSRKFNLSWKLFLAGGLTFIASQVLHIPLVLALTSTFQSWGIVAYAMVLGLLAGIFEETARYILFKFIRKDSKTWNEGVFIGLGHGGTEAIILGVLTALTFINMLAYRNIDMSTVPSIPPEQIELAKQQVAAYWSTPFYLAFLGMIERIFAICLHISLSVMVLYSIVGKKPIWFWIALLWHAIVDASAVYLSQQISMLSVEGIIGIFAIISLGIVFWMKPKFSESANAEAQSLLNETGAGS